MPIIVGRGLAALRSMALAVVVISAMAQPTSAATPSPNNTVVTSTTAAITDASGNQWTLITGGQVAVSPLPPTLNPRSVLANYRPTFGAYGNTVAGYTQDIRDAQAAGVDGFVLDLHGWGADTAPYANFSQLANYMIQAAVNLDTGFKIAFNIDCQGYSWEAACVSEMGAMMMSYANHPNYFRIQNKPLLSAWGSHIDTTLGGIDATFWKRVLASVTGAGVAPYWMPSFSNDTVSFRGSPSVSLTQTDAWYTNGFLNGTVQGLMNWGDLVPALSIVNNGAYSAVAAKHNVAFAPAIESWHSPIRFLSKGNVQPARTMVSVEFNGGEGVSAIWQDVITHLHPQLVYLVTWNDYTENYMGPASQANLAAHNIPSWQVTADYLYTHAAYTELNKYFIQWYKTGIQPAWPDAMYVFYRTAPRNTVASRAPAGTTIGWDTGRGTNPTLDDLYITTILTAPATLSVTTGGKMTTKSVATGLQHTRVPFSTGMQMFSLSRGGTSLASITGANVVSSEPYYYNVNPSSYFAYYRP
jgi:glucan endo-1,3-alpha-glucosidase